MITAKTGLSGNKDAFKAGEEAALKAQKDLKKVVPQFILSSVSSAYDQEKALAGISSVFPGVPLMGGSPIGGMFTEQGIEGEGVGIMALKFEKTQFAITSAEGIEKDSFKTGVALGENLLKECGQPPKLVMVFPAMALANISLDAFMAGLKSKVGNEADIIGGATGNELWLKGDMKALSSQYYKGTIENYTVPAIGFWGDFSSSVVINHGWEPIGLEMKVTKSQQNLIQEIDGRPAIEIYEKYLGRKKEDILKPEFFSSKDMGLLYPLGLILENPKRIIARQIMAATPKGELFALTPISEGSVVRIIQAQANKMPQIAKELTKDALTKLEGKPPQVAFLISCATREMFMIPDQAKESRAVVKAIGKKVPLFGFWSAGEIGSKKEEKDWYSHHETIVIGLMAE